MSRLSGVAVLVSMFSLASGCGSGEAGEPQEGAPQAAAAQEDWVVLFDGQTMNGWEARPTSQPNTSGDWTVANGALVCGGTVPSWIHTDAEFSDFRLTLEFQGADSVNSGVFLRSQKEGQPHVTGYELQIWDYQPAGYLTGALVGSVFGEPGQHVRGGEWNAYDITARGDQFLVVLNGDTLLNATDTTHVSGVIGLQCQPNNPIQFRNIRVLELE